MAETKEWTVMFYFASDNPLAPSVVLQLKAIKDAGFHPEANVVAQFDPNTPGTPTHIFDVNNVNKLRYHGTPRIGFGEDDPYIRSLLEDKLWSYQKARDGKSVRGKIKELLLGKHNVDYNPPIPLNHSGANSPRPGHTAEPGPRQSLESFLRFCHYEYPARHYILFILGHGLVVGNDIFLFDEHAEEYSLSLKDLGEVLGTFREEIENKEAKLELVGFHSCSVSSLEVAYELKDTARYMLASQGPAFVGSWPYRQMLIRLFNDLVRHGKGINIKEMCVAIFKYCLYNSADFLLAGYSYDLCLCNLNKVSVMKEGLQRLSKALIDGLDHPLITDLILLSHLKSQSYWRETYTDLFDFCLCLQKRCDHELNSQGENVAASLKEISDACGHVMLQLKSDPDTDQIRDDDDGFIVRAKFAGPAYQYSNGLSVFFPWSRPAEDSNILDEYRKYKMIPDRGTDLSPDLGPSWLAFLEKYFIKTKREPRKSGEEYGGEKQPSEERQLKAKEEQELQEDIASLVYNQEAQLSVYNSLSGAPTPGKANPLDGTGDSCACASIKNYPNDTRPVRKRQKKAADTDQAIPMSNDSLENLL